MCMIHTSEVHVCIRHTFRLTVPVPRRRIGNRKQVPKLVRAGTRTNVEVSAPRRTSNQDQPRHYAHRSVTYALRITRRAYASEDSCHCGAVKCGSALWRWDPRWPELIHTHASAIDTPLPKPPKSWINMPAMPSAEMPFGGIKDSGYGSEGGPEAVEAYLNVRAVAIMNV